MLIGIDLGTTNSLVAYMTEDGPELIPNAIGEILTPSVVGIDQQGELLVGRSALELQVTKPTRCASVFKLHMGSDWSTTLAGKQFSAVELSSLVLKSLKEDAEAYLKTNIEEAVITVPAYFNELQRKDTIRSGQLAGLTVKRIINEPTAAAIAYGLHHVDSEQVAIVFDLGGGTFDVSIVDHFDGVVEIRASSGEIYLGGEDFTNSLVSRSLEKVGYLYERAEIEYPEMVSRLRRECENVKRMLSRDEKTTVRIPNKKGEIVESCETVDVTREEFSEWTASLLSRTEIPLRRALGDAGLKRSDMDEVILVGGATRMPAVQNRIEQLFHKQPKCSINPDEVVARGAAIQAGLIEGDKSLEELVVTDVAPFTLGIGISREIGGNMRDGYFLPIINRNTTIPVSRVESVQTLIPNQTEILIRVFQGENRRTEGNLLVGEFSVSGIPRGPAGQAIDVRFTYDLNGVLEVEATVIESKRKFTHIVRQYTHGMSNSDLKSALLEMQKLKTHPREEAVNRYTQRRAERLYLELPLIERKQLDMLLSGFEESLELQDKEAIETSRFALDEFLDYFDRDIESSEGDNDGFEW